MYFEHLSIQGFKSFVDRTSIEFKPGITAIIGPNGCGKSNISDAIRWVLGEQNVRTLRGARAEDLIFNGSPKRKPLGMAEVTLTINSNGSFQRALKGQIEITRRLFRNGESEYYINKVPCRLKDIVELFMDSGLGKGNYSLIEQGKVDLILSNKPKERRILLEEAAGIVRYKFKKEEALRKMENTHSNLLRIEDRLYELEERANVLKKQAAKAKRYIREREKLVDYEKQFAAYRLIELEQKKEEVLRESESLLDEITKHETQLAQTVSEKIKKEQELESLREGLQAMYSHKSSLEKEIELSLQNKDFAHKRIKELIQEQENLENEIGELSDKKDSVQIDYGDFETELDTLFEKVNLVSTTVEQREEQLESVQESLTEINQRKEEAYQEHLKIIARDSLLQQQHTKFISLLEEQERRMVRLTKEKSELEQKKRTLQPQLERFTDEIKEIEGTIGQQKQTIEKLQESIQSEHSKLEEIESEYDTTNKLVLRTEARLQSLQELESSYEGYSSGLKFFFTLLEQEGNGQEVSLLADHIRVQEEQQHLVPLALRHYLDAVIVKDCNDALKWAQQVLDLGSGQVTFLARSEFKKKALAQNRRKPGTKGTTLDSFVDCDAEVRPIVQSLLGTTVLVASLSEACEYAQNQPGQNNYITPEGLLLEKDGSLIAGKEKDGASELFSRKQEITDLEQKVEQIQAQSKKLLRKLDQQREVVAQKKEELTDHEAKKQQMQLTLHGLHKDLENFNRELNQLSEMEKINDLELEQTKLDRTTQSEELKLLETDITTCSQEQKRKEQEMKKWEEQVTTLSLEHESVHSELTTQQIELASLNERVERLQSSLESRQEMIDELASHIARNKKRSSEAQNLQTDLENKIVELEETLQTLHGDLMDSTSSVEQGTQEFSALKELVEKDSEWERVLQKTIAPLREKLNQWKLEENTLDIELNHLNEDVQSRLKSTLQEIQSGESIPRTEESAHKLKKKIDSIYRRLEGYEDVNLAAPEEYEGLCTKLEDMNQQRTDVIEAIDTLQQTVKRIDKESIQRFKTCFDEVNANFIEIFQRLFGGGYAELKLEDETDLLDSGIAIIAQPPGKKLQSISLLSGGEKALTAIALLVAIFYYRPSPCCFLDEVDAALDETNTDRFCGLLQEIAEKSQIIMITHSRKSIEAADVFYGVTMSDPGISKIISLKMERSESSKQMSA